VIEKMKEFASTFVSKLSKTASETQHSLESMLYQKHKCIDGLQ